MFLKPKHRFNSTFRNRTFHAKVWIFFVISFFLLGLTLFAQDNITVYPSQKQVAGVIQPVQTAKLAFTRSGILTSISKEGEQVKAGTVLATLDSREAEANVDKANAEIESCRIDLEQAIHIRDVNLDLYTNKSISKRTLSESEFSVKSKEVALLKAMAEQTKTNLNLATCKIQAPFKGVVTVSHGSQSEWVETGKTVVELIDPSILEVKTDIPLMLSKSVNIGLTTQFSDESGQILGNARVKTILPVLDPTSGLRRVIWSIESDEEVLAGRYAILLPWSKPEVKEEISTDEISKKAP